jgi:hypothetical protein
MMVEGGGQLTPWTFVIVQVAGAALAATRIYWLWIGSGYAVSTRLFLLSLVLFGYSVRNFFLL